MGDVEESQPQFTSLSERIAALNKQHVAQSTRPTIESRSKTVNNPAISSFGSSGTKQSNNEPISVRNVVPLPITKYTTIEKRSPPVPQRTPSQSPSIASTNGTPRPSPALPPRLPPKAPQQQLVRHESNESLASITSNISSISALSLGSTRRPSTDTRASADATRFRGLPPPLSEAKLPPLPPSKREIQERELQEKAARQSTVTSKPLISPRPYPTIAKSMPQVPTVKTTPPPSLPPRTSALRPQVPARPSTSSSLEPSPGLAPRSKPIPEQSLRKLPPPFPQRPANTVNPEPQSSPATIPVHVSPPAIPRSSRPTNSQIEQILHVTASLKPKENCCLKCRDFSGPDQLAAQYPRESIPNITTRYLAEVLCRPFTSPTNKARAIFTWLHHNISYDTVAFFGNNVQHATPETTLARGLAVCGGYAGLFTTIATKAGLESVVISGHGKGIGYTDLKPGEKVPPYSAGHAWNAVLIDSNEWKLIDPCWGAGHIVSGTQHYKKSFNPFQFSKSNEDFGLSHFPSDAKYFFRSDGRIPTWEEYFIGPGPLGVQKLQIFGEPSKDHGIDRESFLPAQRNIDVSRSSPGSYTRFQFTKVCEHWNFERHGPGKPYLIGLFINGIDGRGFNGGQSKEEFVPLERNEFFHWTDVETRTLGAAGQKVKLGCITSVNGNDARGLTVRAYKESKGRYGMSFSFIGLWELV